LLGAFKELCCLLDSPFNSTKDLLVTKFIEPNCNMFASTGFSAFPGDDFPGDRFRSNDLVSSSENDPNTNSCKQGIKTTLADLKHME
jgi:hypothetical protein